MRSGFNFQFHWESFAQRLLSSLHICFSSHTINSKSSPFSCNTPQKLEPCVCWLQGPLEVWTDVSSGSSAASSRSGWLQLCLATKPKSASNVHAQPEAHGKTPSSAEVTESSDLPTEGFSWGVHPLLLLSRKEGQEAYTPPPSTWSDRLLVLLHLLEECQPEHAEVVG